MSELPLTQGKVALIDDDDFERVNQFHWCAAFKKWNGLWYAQHTVGKYTEFLHRFVLNLQRGDPPVDHKDGNGLNCQKANLRIATRAENQWNRGPNRLNTSGFKGVSLRHDKPLTKPWVASLVVNGKFISVGMFATPEEAARAYDKAAREYQGEFAYLNFPNE